MKIALFVLALMMFVPLVASASCDGDELRISVETSSPPDTTSSTILVLVCGSGEQSLRVEDSPSIRTSGDIQHLRFKSFLSMALMAQSQGDSVRVDVEGDPIANISIRSK
jgi:hypothetical protein